MGCCRFCERDKPLVKAHIIPEGFFRRARHENEMPRLLSNDPAAYPKRAPIGVYDPDILCDQCERQFAEWDRYAQRLLTEPPTGTAHYDTAGKVLAWIVPDYNYAALKLFAISILWRASVSTQSFFRRISAGPFEHEARQAIAQRDPGPIESFATLVSRLDGVAGGVLFDPYRLKVDGGVNFYVFHLGGDTAGGYLMYVKADQRRAPDIPFGQFMIRPHQPLTIIVRGSQDSKELRIAQTIIKSPKNARIG